MFLNAKLKLLFCSLRDLCIFHKQTQNFAFQCIINHKTESTVITTSADVFPPAVQKALISEKNKCCVHEQSKQLNCYGFPQNHYHVNRVMETSGGVLLKCSTSGSSTDRWSQSSAAKPELVMRRDN